MTGGNALPSAGVEPGSGVPQAAWALASLGPVENCLTQFDSPACVGYTLSDSGFVVSVCVCFQTGLVALFGKLCPEESLVRAPGGSR